MIFILKWRSRIYRSMYARHISYLSHEYRPHLGGVGPRFPDARSQGDDCSTFNVRGASRFDAAVSGWSAILDARNDPLDCPGIEDSTDLASFLHAPSAALIASPLMQVSIFRAGRGQSLTVTVSREGKLVFSDEFHPSRAKDHRRVAAAVGISYTDLLSMIGEFTSNGGTVVRDFDSGERTGQAFEIRCCGGVESTFAGEVAEAFFSAATHASGNGQLRWSDAASLCCLDIDYHGQERNDALRESLVAFLRPQPFAWHLSKGGGIHAYYHSMPGMAADELAAVAAVGFSQIDTSAAFELKCDTWAPVNLQRGTQTDDFGGLFQDDEAAPPEHLGFEVGKRYPHSACPFNPSVDDKRDPVIAMQTGVFCHSCASKGVGYASYSSLGNRTRSRLRTMVERFTHWEHAKLVFHDLVDVPERIARLAYHVMVRRGRESDPRVERVFEAGRDLIRASGRWVGANWTTTWNMAYAASVLAQLPACQDANGDPDRATVDRFRQNQADLCHWGYFPVTPVRGLKIYGHHNTYSDANRVTLVTQTSKLAHDVTRQPRYVKPKDRMPEEDAWQLVEHYFPGINRQLVKLLIAGKGVAEGGGGMPPFCVIHGPSSSGKSGTIHVAAGIAGDLATEFEFENSTERLRQCLLDALDRGTFAVVNEVFKSDRAKKLGYRAAIDPILNFTPNSVSHKLYVGPVALARSPVLVMTDTSLPREVVSDTQIGRRLIYCHLPNRIDWESRVAKEADGREFSDFRFFSPDAARAANAIVSSLIDEFFSTSMVFRDIASELGLFAVSESPEFTDERRVLRRFFDLVNETPEVGPPDQKRLGSRGWKKLSRNEETELVETWLQIADGEHEGFTSSRRCEEVDWSQVLGLEKRRIDFKVSRRSVGVVFVRFVEPSTGKVNGEVLV